VGDVGLDPARTRSSAGVRSWRSGGGGSRGSAHRAHAMTFPWVCNSYEPGSCFPRAGGERAQPGSESACRHRCPRWCSWPGKGLCSSSALLGDWAPGPLLRSAMSDRMGWVTGLRGYNGVGMTSGCPAALSTTTTGAATRGEARVSSPGSMSRVGQTLADGGGTDAEEWGEVALPHLQMPGPHRMFQQVDEGAQ
jgi:hypothetical protein